MGATNMNQFRIALVAIALFTLTGCRDYITTVKVTNRAKISVQALTVTVQEQKKSSQKAIRPGESIVFEFSVKRDSDYLVEVTFVNGKKNQKRVGYITRGFDYNDQIDLYEDTVKVTSEPK
jgi:starvation-inducible outer membrane lipoprotein